MPASCRSLSERSIGLLGEGGNGRMNALKDGSRFGVMDFTRVMGMTRADVSRGLPSRLPFVHYHKHSWDTAMRQSD